MFEFKIGANTDPASLPSFNIDQFNLEEQILLFIQNKNENLVRIQELLIILRERAELILNSGY